MRTTAQTATRSRVRANPYRESASSISSSRMNAQLIGEESIDQQLRAFQGALTPQSVSQVLRYAKMGRPRQMVSLVYDIRRRDGHIHDCVQTRELGVQTLKLAVVPPPSLKEHKRRYKRCQTIANELEESLRKSRNLFPMVAGLQGDGLLFGRAHWEVIWKKHSTGSLWFDRFANINARRFIFRQSDAALLFDTKGDENEADGVDLESTMTTGKIVKFHPRINGDSLLQEGLAELVCWIGMFRNWGVRDYLQTAESSWKPRRLGYYQKDASDRDKQGLVQAMKRLSQTGSAVLADTTKIEELWAMARMTNDHHTLLTWLGREFTKATLGSPDAIEPSDTGSAKVDVQYRAVLREELRRSDSIGQSLALTEYLAEPFTFFNYGRDADAPMILLLTEDVQDVTAYAGVVETLQRTGLPISADDVYDKSGFRKPEPGETILVSPMWTNEGAGTGGGTNTSGTQSKPPAEDSEGSGDE